MHEHDTAADWAWAAGLFEGEGSAVCTPYFKKRTRYQRFLVVTSTDADVLEKFCAIVGAGVVRYNQRRNAPVHYKPVHRWTCSNWSDIERIARGFLPWLCERRRQAVEFLLDNPAGPVGGRLTDQCKHGHPRTDEDTYIHPKTGTRHCRPCNRVRSRTWNANHQDYFREYHQAVRKTRNSKNPARQEGSEQP